MASIGEQWQTVAARFGDVLEEDDPQPVHFHEAASLVGDVAEREEEIFEAIAVELGRVTDAE